MRAPYARSRYSCFGPAYASEPGRLTRRRMRSTRLKTDGASTSTRPAHTLCTFVLVGSVYGQTHTTANAACLISRIEPRARSGDSEREPRRYCWQITSSRYRKNTQTFLVCSTARTRAHSACRARARRPFASRAAAARVHRAVHAPTWAAAARLTKYELDARRRARSRWASAVGLLAACGPRV